MALPRAVNRAGQASPPCRVAHKLNPPGWPAGLGDPFGLPGARILCTLPNGLWEKDRTFGLETMCGGGGQGMAMILERLD